MREAHAFLYLGYSRHLASLTARMAQRLRSRSQVQTAWVCIPVLLLMASLVAQMVKESACNARNPDLIPGSGRYPGAGNGNPLQ